MLRYNRIRAFAKRSKYYGKTCDDKFTSIDQGYNKTECQECVMVIDGNYSMSRWRIVAGALARKYGGKEMKDFIFAATMNLMRKRGGEK